MQNDYRLRNPPRPRTPRLSREQQKRWRTGWRYVFPSFWLIYLGQTASGVNRHASGWVAIAGYLIIVAFAACYLAALPAGWTSRRTLFWWLYAATFVLLALELPIAHEDALVFWSISPSSPWRVGQPGPSR